MQQTRLFRLAPEAIHLGATFVAGEGWHLSVTMRRQDEQWPDAYRAVYTGLTTPELLDILCEESGSQLGLA